MSLGNNFLGLFGLGLDAAGIAGQSYFAYQQAKAENAAAEWNASLLSEDAKVKDMQAEQALTAGRHEAAIQAREGRLAVEAGRGRYAASGVTVDEGSPLRAAAEQAGRNQYDQDMIRYNAQLAAWGHRTEAAGLRNQSLLVAGAKRSPWAAAGATLLSGTTRLYQQYFRG
jgi:hypothetical protein